MLYFWCNGHHKESASDDKFSMTAAVKKQGAMVLGKTFFTAEFSSSIGSNRIKIFSASRKIGYEDTRKRDATVRGSLLVVTKCFTPCLVPGRLS